MATPPYEPSNSTTPGPAADSAGPNPVPNGQVKPSLPLDKDIMQCARIGALEHIQKMLQDGTYDIKYKDEENITPLHWAAINNQYAVCKYLLEQGADVNAIGGESQATAAMWAAQRCHFYIVHLMIQHGANLLLADGQGYNILHLATIDGNALLVILLLHQNIPVDVADPLGHTSLMWAGYKGWPACVDLLLKWGANVNAKDDNGYSPLHWALVKGSKPCLEKLLEYGADRFAKTNEGKTPFICAQEMNSKGPYHRALHDQGYGHDGHPRALPLGLSSIVRDKSKMATFFFLFPFIIVFLVLFLISSFSIFISIPLSVVAFLGMQIGVQRLARLCPPEIQNIHNTPFLAGIFSSTLFFVGLDWVGIIVPATFSGYPLSNLAFAFFFGSTLYFYQLSMREDPGFIPKHASRNQQQAVIEELFAQWKFDEENYCLQCMVRRPLRSKHCRKCHRCVAKIDHHCPWINNCVASNNHRHFFIYIVSLFFGILLYVRLVMAYLETLPEPSKDLTCNILKSTLCAMVTHDSWTIALALWSTLQLVWVTLLLVVQSVQIGKNQTTWENMKRHSEPSHGRSHLPQHNARPTTLGADQGLQSLDDAAASATRIQPKPRKKDGCLTKWMKLLGLDTFIATASDATSGKLQTRGNPYSRGMVRNCKDFWLDPAPLFGSRHNGESFLDGEVVDYTKMYDTPIRSRGGRRAGGMTYSSVAGEDNDD